MPTQCLENYDRKGTGGSARRRTTARDEYAFLAPAKRGDSAAFEVLCIQSADTVSDRQNLLFSEGSPENINISASAP